MGKNYLLIFVMAALLICFTAACFANGNNTCSNGSKNTIPPGWENGNKTGWNGEKMPPGLAKKASVSDNNSPSTPQINDTGVASWAAPTILATPINTTIQNLGGVSTTISGTEITTIPFSTFENSSLGTTTSVSGSEGNKNLPGVFNKLSDTETSTDKGPTEKTPPKPDSVS